MSCLYTPYVSPIEKKLRDRLKAARARMEGQACRRDPVSPLRTAQVVQVTAPVELIKPEYKPWFRIVGLERPMIRDVQEAVCDYFEIQRDHLLSNRRKQAS